MAHVSIRYRIDSSETFETDTNHLYNTGWPKVLAEIYSIEAAGNTVLEVINHL